MYKIMMFEGGVYRFNELKELIEDIGGFIVQELVMQTDTILHLAFPEEEERVVRDKIKDLGGKIKELPLAGSEIMVVAPSLGKHHAVHPICDIDEFLRREGAVTNMMALARGVGKRIAQLTAPEKKIIEECDAAVFVCGNISECVEEKAKLFEVIEVPHIIVAGPPELPIVNYVGGLGRKTDRLRRKGEIDKLGEIAHLLGTLLDERRREVDEDPLAASPLFIKELIEMSVPPKEGEEQSIVMHLDGLRLNIEDTDAPLIEELEIGTKKLAEICTIKKSLYRGYLLTILTEAETGGIF